VERHPPPQLPRRRPARASARGPPTNSLAHRTPSRGGTPTAGAGARAAFAMAPSPTDRGLASLNAQSRQVSLPTWIRTSVSSSRAQLRRREATPSSLRLPVTACSGGELDVRDERRCGVPPRALRVGVAVPICPIQGAPLTLLFLRLHRESPLGACANLPATTLCNRASVRRQDRPTGWSSWCRGEVCA
jgi:hypothetical protein